MASRAPGRGALMSALAALAAALVAAPAALPAQPTTPAMQQAVSALTRALQQKNFEVLAPYLDEGFRVDQVTGPFARQMLQQVVLTGRRVPSSVNVESVGREGELTRVNARFAFEDGDRTVGLLLTPAGKFVELPFFHIQMSPGAAPPGGALGGGAAVGGVRIRATGAPPGAAGGAAPQGSAHAPSDPALRQQLMAMMEQDQRFRRQVMSATAPGARPNPDAGTVRQMEAADRENVRRLLEIVDRVGWPGISRVGPDGSVAAFLVLQHADAATQQRLLPLVRRAEAEHEIAPSLLATLEDRVRVGQGRTQLYGTQLHSNPSTGRMELYPIDDEAHVDTRRAGVGLPPLAEYLSHMGIQYTPPAHRE